jgi:uncharacterized protein
VKSGAKFAKPKGLEVFGLMYTNSKPLIVGEGAVPLQEFLSQPIQHWLD